MFIDMSYEDVSLCTLSSIKELDIVCSFFTLYLFLALAVCMSSILLQHNSKILIMKFQWIICFLCLVFCSLSDIFISNVSVLMFLKVLNIESQEVLDSGFT